MDIEKNSMETFSVKYSILEVLFGYAQQSVITIPSCLKIHVEWKKNNF